MMKQSLIRFTRRVWILPVLSILAGSTACSDNGTVVDEAARVQVRLTDAPADFIESAEVWVSRVYLQPDTDSDAGRVDLFNDPENPQHYDLLDLRNGIVADLTEPVSVESGVYNGLRLVVDSARVTLIADFTFDDGSTTKNLKVPSGSASGIKVQLAQPIDAAAGQLTVVLVDFDVDKNFVFQGPPTRPKSVLFTPTLVEIDIP